MTFHIGQMVVCVDTSELGSNGDGLEKGRIYTVREPCNCRRCQRGGPLSVRLEEIVRPIRRRDDCEIGFWAHRFRPIKKTSIEQLRKIVANPPRELMEEKA